MTKTSASEGYVAGEVKKVSSSWARSWTICLWSVSRWAKWRAQKASGAHWRLLSGSNPDKHIKSPRLQGQGNQLCRVFKEIWHPEDAHKIVEVFILNWIEQEGTRVQRQPSWMAGANDLIRCANSDVTSSKCKSERFVTGQGTNCLARKWWGWLDVRVHAKTVLQDVAPWVDAERRLRRRTRSIHKRRKDAYCGGYAAWVLWARLQSSQST
jgi:hypothetical protein